MLRNMKFSRLVLPALVAIALIMSCTRGNMSRGRDKSGTNPPLTLAGFSQVVKEPLLTSSGSLDTERGRNSFGCSSTAAGFSTYAPKHCTLLALQFITTRHALSRILSDVQPHWLTVPIAFLARRLLGDVLCTTNRIRRSRRATVTR